MSDNTDANKVDPYQICHINRNPDGTITRLRKIYPDVPADHSSDPNLAVLSKDIPLNHSKYTCLRLFIPRESLRTLGGPTSSYSKLPLILYFHGGGFVLLSAASSIFHAYCADLSASIPALVASLDYALCPEHRLPGPYDDATEALRWIRTASGAGDEPWLRDHADLSNVFLMGDSAGGNIAYRAGLRAAAEAEAGDVRPVVVRGIVLNQPFFGGVRRTASEVRLADDRVAPLCVCDMMWELALPEGADRDHEYSCPTAEEEGLESVKRRGMKVLVTGWDGDPLFDRQADVAKMLEEKGVRVVANFGVGECHAVEVTEPSKAQLLFDVVRNFIWSS